LAPKPVRGFVRGSPYSVQENPNLPECFKLPKYEPRFAPMFPELRPGIPYPAYPSYFPYGEFPESMGKSLMRPYARAKAPPMFLPLDAAKKGSSESIIKGEFSENEEDSKKSDEDVKDEDSLSGGEKPEREKRILGTSAYKKRNVYKSIVRHMFGYMRKHREEITTILKNARFKTQDIEHAFYKINYYNDMERQKGNPKRSQSIVKKIVNKKCIYTYLLRETLKNMMNIWEQGRMGKVSTANREIYKEVCKKFYNQTVRTLGEAPPGL